MKSLTEIFQLGIFIKDAFCIWPFFVSMHLIQKHLPHYINVDVVWKNAVTWHFDVLQHFYRVIKEKLFILVFLWFPKNYHSWQRGKKKKQKPLTEEINSSMSAQYRCVSLRNVSTAAQEVWGLRRGQSRAKSRLPWPLCGQLGQAPFLRKQPSPGSSPPFVVLPTRWSVEVSVVTEPVCNRLVFHGPV